MTKQVKEWHGTEVHYDRMLRDCSGYFRIAFESTSTVVHSHNNFYELMLVTGGEWKNVTPAGSHMLSLGSITLYTPSTVHQLCVKQPQSEHLVICIEREYFDDFVSRCFPKLPFPDTSSFFSVEISEEKLQYIKHLGNKIVHGTQMSQTVADEILYLSISSLLSLFVIPDSQNYVLDIIHKLDTFYYLNHTVDEICSSYPSSKSLLTLQFKTITGTTIVNYKARQKIKYAAHLLKNTDIKILDIASTLQYGSLSYFVHRFKSEYGVAPLEYRRTCKEKLNIEK